MSLRTCALASTSKRSCTIAIDAADTSTGTGACTAGSVGVAGAPGTSTARRKRAVAGRSTPDWLCAHILQDEKNEEDVITEYAYGVAGDGTC